MRSRDGGMRIDWSAYKYPRYPHFTEHDPLRKMLEAQEIESLITHPHDGDNQCIDLLGLIR
jgi:hypothetical protein